MYEGFLSQDKTSDQLFLTKHLKLFIGVKNVEEVSLETFRLNRGYISLPDLDICILYF